MVDWKYLLVAVITGVFVAVPAALFWVLVIMAVRRRGANKQQ